MSKKSQALAIFWEALFSMGIRFYPNG